MCQANKYFQAKTFCRCLSLRTGCLLIALFSDLLGIVALAGFFLSFLDGTHDNMVEEILDVFWGVLHFVAGNCMSYSLLMKSPTPILVYIVTEALFLAFAIIYVPLSFAIDIKMFANLCHGHCVSYWIFICLIFVYLDKRQRLSENPQPE
ncbi:uncharacterized protein LOC111071209 isoform X2 [Drosophila obscura]|uniref:uncharacterized protein LOC111071209 isoform X2 n=1 Tax=Drosophila obscura TaxID=7282 RepID=UPI001BB1845A|nr:uncharacterized protein LOC111071209 isoform X2 [Drosophila obscura]